MPAAAVSAWRTAAVSIIALRELMVVPYSVIAVIGAGPIAEAHLNLLTRHFPRVEEVRVFDCERQRAMALIKRMGKKKPGGVEFAVEASAETAIRGSDVVIAATTVTDGYLPYAWLTPGAVVVNVSLDDVLPEVVERAQLVIVDDWGLISNDSRRLFGRLYREGRLRGPEESLPPDHRARRVDASIGDLLLRKHFGRTDPHDTVLVNPFGMAIGDIAYADVIYQWAVTNGLGSELEL
jgi:ornithine cyclodeaminase